MTLLVHFLLMCSLQLSVALVSVPQLMAKFFSLVQRLVLWPPTLATMATVWLVPAPDPVSPMDSGLGMPPLAVVSVGRG